MTADRRPLLAGLYRAVCLLAALAVVLTAQPAAAATRATALVAPAAPRTVSPPTRVEGLIRAIDGNSWRVDDIPVILGPNIVIDQQRGAAEVDAWVLVIGNRSEGYVVADYIEVKRPSSRPAPTYQFTGPLTKQGGTFWFVGATRILVVGGSTNLVGNLVPGSLVRATVRRAGDELEATEVREIALTPELVPSAIEGVVQQVTDSTWVVDANTIYIPQDKNLPVDQGDTVEVAALQQTGGLVAQEVRLVDPSLQANLSGLVSQVEGLGAENQTWAVVAFEGDHPITHTIHLTGDTYVDEDRSVLQAQVEAQVQGDKAGPDGVDAAFIRLEQPVPDTVRGALTAGQMGNVWRVGNQRVWFRSNQLAQQALAAAGRTFDDAAPLLSRGPTQDVAVRGLRLTSGVLVAQEVLTGAAATTALPLASNGVAGEWAGPIDVTPTVDKAARPTVLVDGAGTGHAVFEWRGLIYYSSQPHDGAWGAPIKIGTGVAPTAVLDGKGVVHVSYRSEFLGNYDIMHVYKLSESRWTLPTVVAPTTGSSADPAIAADTQGNVYVAWMDRTSGEWMIQLGTWDGRYWTTVPVYYGHGQSPAITVMPDGALFLAWQDRLPGIGDAYGKYDIVVSERRAGHWTLPTNISDNQVYHPGADSIGVHVTAAADQQAHLAWVDNNTQVRYLFGREGYWPAPYDVGAQRALVRGVGLQTGSDGLLYLALDEGATIGVIATPPRTAAWPGAQLVAVRTAPTSPLSDVALTAGTNNVVVSWVQPNGLGYVGVYESRHATIRQWNHYYLPLLLKP